MTTVNPIALGQLAQALKNGEAVLILGPDIETVTMPDGSTCLLQVLLSQHLKAAIKQRVPDLQLMDSDNVSYIAQHFEDVHGKQAATLLGESVQAFYAQYRYAVLPIYQQIANAGFRYIINTNPNKLIVSAFEEQGYLLADNNFAYYHYQNPTHNQQVLVENDNISEETPLIYNLFGSASNDTTSLVLTETQQLLFVETILQTDKDTIPPNIAIQFMSRRNSPINKRLVFLGFDFGDWRLRIILHVINRYQTQGALKSYAPQDLNSLDKLNRFFYQRNFNFDFIPSNAKDFLTELAQQSSIVQDKPAPNKPQLHLFMMYHENDEAILNDLEEHLSLLKREGLVEWWHKGKMVGGATRDQTINEQLNSANVILLLVSPDFLACDALYDDQLQKALEKEKAKQAFVIPIIARPCVWEGALFKDLKTILPSPRGRKPLYDGDKQLTETALAKLAEEIGIICRKLLDRLNEAK